MNSVSVRNTLHIKGDFNITHSKELKSLIIEAINNYELIFFDISKSNYIHLTFLQLLCAAQMNFARE